MISHDMSMPAGSEPSWIKRRFDQPNTGTKLLQFFTQVEPRKPCQTPKSQLLPGCFESGMKCYRSTAPPPPLGGTRILGKIGSTEVR